MPELRKDPIIGQWVVVHTEDSLGPDQYDKEDRSIKHLETCQFSPGKEHQTPPEIDAIRPSGSGWAARVVPNKSPALRIEGNLDEQKIGLFDRSNGIGAHEVLIEAPRHNENIADLSRDEVAYVVELYQRRLVDLTGDKRFKYIVIFKNFGESAGASVEHPHSQIIALPMIPKYVLEGLEGARAYQKKHQKCIYCAMLEQEYADQNRIIAQNEEFVAFCPFVPRYAFEFWIMPKQHDLKFASMEEGSRQALAGILKETLQRLKQCLSNPSYNYYLHCMPINMEEQEEFHWHIEVVPKLTKTTGFEWGTGFYRVRTSPKVAAEYLRDVCLTESE